MVKIHLGQLSIATGLRYTGPEKSITPYFNFGMLNVFHINSNSEWTRKTDDNSYLINKQALVIKGKQTGLWGGVGIIKSISPKLKFLVDARYEWTDGLSNYPRTGLKSAISNLQQESELNNIIYRFFLIAYPIIILHHFHEIAEFAKIKLIPGNIVF